TAMVAMDLFEARIPNPPFAATDRIVLNGFRRGACFVAARVWAGLKPAPTDHEGGSRAAHHGCGLDSAVVVPLFQQVRERYRSESTFISGGRDASAVSTIGPAICTSCPTWKFSIS